jgi:hypothetical protein
MEYVVYRLGDTAYNSMTLDVRIKYPALYRAAGDASADAQSKYLWLLRIEYFLLFGAACFSAFPIVNPNEYVVYALVFISALVVLLIRSFMKPEQTWYKSRALAESIKTSTWRYMMRADPYGDASRIAIPRGEFRNHLREILAANKFPEGTFATSSAEEQVTNEMDSVRRLNLDERKAVYLQYRIKEQRGWYSRKAGMNRKAFRRWVGACVFIYLLATASVLLQIRYPEWPLHPTEPLTVIAASVIGWVQIKKFSELAASYSLAAHEIGLAQGQLSEAETEGQFSDFVIDTEQAFSREHTQWVARQQN